MKEENMKEENMKEDENMNAADLVNVFDIEVHLLLQISAELVTISNIFIICSTHELSQVKRWGIWPYADYLRLRTSFKIRCNRVCLRVPRSYFEHSKVI